MSLWDDIFGEKEKTNSSGVQTQQTYQNRNSDSTLISQLLERVLRNTSSTSALNQNVNSNQNIASDATRGQQGTTRKGTTESNAAIMRLVGNIPGVLSQYSKENAILDSKEGVSAAIKEVLAMGLPEIRTASTTAGGYDSTTRQLLTDNLTAQAATAGAKVRQDTINTYLQAQGEGANLLTQLLGLAQEGESSFIENEVSALTEGRTGSENTSATETTDATDETTSSSEGREDESFRENIDNFVNTQQQGNVTGRSSPGLIGGISDIIGLFSPGK